MTRNVFSQIIVFIATILMVLMFFFSDIKAVQKMVLSRIDIITFILVVGLYIRDLFRQSP